MTYKTVVAIGDSVIEGVGDATPNLELVSFSRRFADALKYHTPNLEFVNLARRGSTSQDVITHQLPTALNLHPDIILIGVGANDPISRSWSVELTRQNLEAIIHTLSQRDITIITMTYIDGVSVLGDNAAAWIKYLRPRMIQIWETVRDLSQKYDTFFVDYWALTPLFQAEDWSSDGVHPNARAHLKIAHQMIEAYTAHTGIALPLPQMLKSG